MYSAFDWLNNFTKLLCNINATSWSLIEICFDFMLIFSQQVKNIMMHDSNTFHLL